MSDKSISPLPEINLITIFGRENVNKAADFYGVSCKSGLAFATDDHESLVMLIGSGGTDEQIMALIAHESYHLACRYFEVLGDESPSEESMAYVIDAIFLEAETRFLAGEYS